MDIHVRVTPNASKNQIKPDTAADGTPVLRVYVTVPPEDGKANAEVVKLLAKHLGVAKSALTVVRGHTSRDKIIRMDD